MKILITGSNGFIGNYACNRLKKEHNIIGIGTKKKNTISEIEYYQGDIVSNSFVAEIKDKVESCDVIIHLAAYIDKDDFNDKLIDVNCKGTLNIVQLAIALGAKKIIYSSSLPVIGEPMILPITEEHQVHPNTLYHITKLMSEHILNLAIKFGIKSVYLRIPSPIGIGMNENTILPIILKSCLKDEPITIYGKGQRKQNYIDVRDIVEAIALATISDKVEGIYNIASEKVISNIELANLCISITKSKSEIIFNDKVDLEESYCWDTSIKKASNTFSFQPKYALNETITGILKYWEEEA